MSNIIGTEPRWWECAAFFVLVCSAALPIYTYFGYPLILIALKPFRKAAPPKDMSDEELPSVTMVVAAHNEASVIAEKVRNFLAIDYPPDKLDLVIGSDGSDDETVRIAREASRENSRVAVREFKERRGKVNVLNDVVPGLSRPVILFSDANTMYAPDAVRKLVRHFKDKKTGAVCGKLVLKACGKEASAGEALYWRYELFIKELEGKPGGLTSITGSVFAIRRELYEHLPDDALTEDQHLGLRIMARGWKVYYEPECVVEETVGNISAEKKRRVRISTGNFQTLFRAGLAMLSPLRGFSAFAYFSHKVLRWMVPLAMLAALGANGLLAGHWWAQWLLAGQLVFYAAAFAPSIVPVAEKFAPVRMIRYFVVMNAAIAEGFLRYLFTRQKAAWERTQR